MTKKYKKMLIPVTGVIAAVVCAFMAVSGSFADSVVAGDPPLRSTTRIFLPYISRPGVPPPAATPTATATHQWPTPTHTATPTATATTPSTPTPTATATTPSTHTPTATPTNTPAPTATPTRTPPPTATATSDPSKIKILGNHSSYVDVVDYLHVLGEVQNNTDNYLRFIKVTARALSRDGQTLGSGSAYIYLNSLPPGEKTCFDILLKQPEGWSGYRLEDPTYSTDGSPLPKLTILNSEGSQDPATGWYRITGQVRNDHGTRIDYVSPIGTAYNASGSVVGCNITYVSGNHLTAGQASPFEMLFTDSNAANIRSYRIQVDGDIK